jgi:hypothetical protein
LIEQTPAEEMLPLQDDEEASGTSGTSGRSGEVEEVEK